MQFTNDGSFMEQFMKLQQQQGAGVAGAAGGSSGGVGAGGGPEGAEKDGAARGVGKAPAAGAVLKPVAFSANKLPTAAGGSNSSKLSFSLKAKKAVANALKLADDDDDAGDTETHDQKRQRTAEAATTSSAPTVSSSGFVDAASIDEEVRRVADKLAEFVAKNGRQFEEITRQRNPGNTPFSFLFDANCKEYKYYLWKLAQSQTTSSGNSPSTSASTTPPQSSQYTHRPAVVGTDGGTREGRRRPSLFSVSAPEAQAVAVPGAPDPRNSLAMMEFFMKQAAQQDMRKPAALEYPKPEEEVEEEPVPVKGPKGHHMGDYIPQEELVKFYEKVQEVNQNKAYEAFASAKLAADNIGHKLLSKMGWKEGQGLGSNAQGIAVPVSATDVRTDTSGIGVEKPGELKEGDDIYEQYKKRMMLGYRFRPNPLNNPRKQYY
eukprot:jgi/Chlat1/5521/Chrsp369S05339